MLFGITINQNWHCPITCPLHVSPQESRISMNHIAIQNIYVYPQGVGVPVFEADEVQG
jgi:hypothetical protein